MLNFTLRQGFMGPVRAKIRQKGMLVHFVGKKKSTSLIYLNKLKKEVYAVKIKQKAKPFHV